MWMVSLYTGHVGVEVVGQCTLFLWSDMVTGPSMDGAMDGAQSEAGLARWTTPFCERSNAWSALLQGEYGDSERESVLDASIDVLRGKALLQLLL